MSIDMVDPDKSAKIIKADLSLQKKIGNGPLDERVVKRCQQVMDTNNVDFEPLAKEFLDILKKAITEIKYIPAPDKTHIQALTAPVMQLKANAATFRYTLVGNLANVMLGFLETVSRIDDDVLEIVAAHERTLSVIVTKKIRGDGGDNGKLLEDELKNACNRYLAKKK